MVPNAIPVKTERGRLALRGRAFSGSRAQRALLIMVDGRQTVDKLAPAMASLGLSWSDLQQMADTGLMAWQAGAEPGPVAPPAIVPPPMPAALPIAEPDPALQPAYEVAEALLIGLDQTQRLLGDADRPLRDAAARVQDAAGLRQWLTMATAMVSTHLGDSAAAGLHRFLADRLDGELLASLPIATTAGEVDISL